MLMFKRMLLLVSSFAIIGMTVQFFVVILTAVNEELFLVTSGLQASNFIF